jgi:Ohr subfamily peroxiredoxin
MATKVLYTGATHNTSGPNGGARSSDGLFDLQLPQPHPAAENLFGAAWSACYAAAIQGVAALQKVTLPEFPTVDTTIDLSQGPGGYSLSARLHVTLPGIDRELGEELIAKAHKLCPYSKAVHGNIDIVTTLA